MTLQSPKATGTVLIVLLIAVMVISIGTGAVHTSPGQSLAIICKYVGIHTSVPFNDQQEAVLTIIRMPRILLAVFTGAVLAISGAALQGLFRNPLADPALIGVSSGASVTAVSAIVFGRSIFSSLSMLPSTYVLCIITFSGAFITTMVVYRFSKVNGKTIVSSMLLAGIAVNALASAFTGLLTYSANDAQLRSITFWSLGSLGGATWSVLSGVLLFILVPVIVLPMMARPLNVLALGEANAQHLGVNVERTKRIIIILAAMGVGASVSVTGIIGFVGLVVPHIIRSIAGPDNRHLLPLSAICGAFLVVLADLTSRTIFFPAELPIGIVTSLIGAPFFLYLLLKERKTMQIA